jgi:hypothetical protein
MPDRTTVVFPPGLKQLAMERARERKISFAEFVREAVESAIHTPKPKRKRAKDTFWGDLAVYDGPVPTDISINHDKYLYDEPEPE